MNQRDIDLESAQRELTASIDTISEKYELTFAELVFVVMKGSQVLQEAAFAEVVWESGDLGPRGTQTKGRGE